ncbi:MAG: cell division protein FtsA, partial [Lentilactobacillus hilgardii]
PGGSVLTGGVAALPGIAEWAADQFNTNVRVYIPDQMGLRHPSFTAGLSLVSYFSDISDVEMIVRSAVGATSTKVPKLTDPQDAQVPVSSKSDKPKRKTQKKKRGEGIKNFFSDFFD